MKWEFFSVDLKNLFLENNSFRDAETWLETSSGKVNSSFFKSLSPEIWWGNNGGWILIAMGTVEYNIIRKNVKKNQIYLWKSPGSVNSRLFKSWSRVGDGVKIGFDFHKDINGKKIINHSFLQFGMYLLVCMKANNDHWNNLSMKKLI